MTPHLLCYFQLQCSQHNKDVDLLGKVHGDAQWAGAPPAGKHAERVGAVQFEKRRLRGDLIPMFQGLKGGYREAGDWVFSRSHKQKTRGNRYKLFLERFHLDTRGKFS